MNLLELSLIGNGGLVMWPIMGVSLISFIIILERTLFLHRGQIRPVEFIAGIKNLLEKRRLIEALTVCEDTPGPVGAVVKAGLLNYDQTESRIRGVMQSAALVKIPDLEMRIGTLAALARICPLLGLLGTVIGLMKAFFNLQAEGAYAHMGILAGGLGEALISTAAGLSVAIVVHLAHHFLNGRVRALVHDMEWVGNDLLQYLLRELPEEEVEEGADGEAGVGQRSVG